jgi:cysteine desulfuration protein SufE
MNEVVKRQDELIQEYAQIPTWEERYKHLINQGKIIGAMPKELYDEKFKVRGCQSQVWLHASLLLNGKIQFQGDSDALIVKGLVALLIRTYSGASPEDILGAKTDFLKELGFEGHLSPSRANGLYAMLKQILYYATAFQALAKMSSRN